MMMNTPRALRYLTKLALAMSMTLSYAHADDYTDAVQLTRSGNYTEAMAKVDKFLAKTPKDPKMRLLKGLIQDRTGKTSEAILTLLRLVEDNPDLPEPYNNLAVFYASQNQYDKARTALEMAVRNDPGYSTAHENLGDVYAELARQSYRKALQNNAGDQSLERKVELIRDIFAPGTSKTAKSSATTTAVTSTEKAPSAPTPVVATSAPAKAASANVEAAAKPVPPAQSDAESKRVEEAVMAWASAWSSKNMQAYLGAYGKDFVPAGNVTREAWEADRTARITSKAKISVGLTNLQISVEGNKAVAKFRQSYKATGLSITDFKTLELTKFGDRWEITRETVGG